MRYLGFLLLLLGAAFLSSCSIPGWGFSHASDIVDSYIGSEVESVFSEGQGDMGVIRLKIGKWVSGKRFYLIRPEGGGKRYYLNFWEGRNDRCKYSLYVDEYGVVKSWRDEGGVVPMNKCYVG